MVYGFDNAIDSSSRQDGDGPALTRTQAAHSWAQTFEATWQEAQNFMAQARALDWKGQLGSFMPKQSPYRARMVYATCYVVRLGVTRSASEALSAAALVSGFHYKGEISADLDHLHGDLAYALASVQIRAEKRSVAPGLPLPASPTSPP